MIDQENSQIKKEKTVQEILKDRYKDTISMFLRDNTLYDCLAVNNQVTVIDQSFSCFDVIKIFKEESLDEVIFWNSDISNYDGMFTYTDIIKVVLRFYQNAVNNVTPGMIFKKTNQFLAYFQRLGKIEEEPEIEEDYTSNYKIDTPVKFGSILTQQQRERFSTDLKHLPVKQWFSAVESDNVTQLVKGLMNERLDEACMKLLQSNIHRIIVVDDETRMVAGTIQQRDVLVFLIKGFSQYFSEVITHHPNGHSDNLQHKLQIGYFFEEGQDSIEKYKQPCARSSSSVLQVFHDLVYSLKRTSIPIIDENNSYLGLIHRRDFIFIIRDDNYDMLAWTVGSFLVYLQKEKRKYNVYQILTKEKFTKTQTVKEVVENLVLSEGCFLVCLDNQNQVEEQLSISDIFNFFLSES